MAGNSKMYGAHSAPKMGKKGKTSIKSPANAGMTKKK